VDKKIMALEVVNRVAMEVKREDMVVENAEETATADKEDKAMEAIKEEVMAGDRVNSVMEVVLIREEAMAVEV
jgi:hypothetical protein